MSLRVAMLVFTALTVWLGLRAMRIEKERRVTELRAQLGDFAAVNQNEFAMRRSASLSHPCAWDIFLPREGSFDLCLATQGTTLPGFPPAEKRFRLANGYRQIKAVIGGEMIDNRLQLLVILKVDEREAISKQLSENSFITTASFGRASPKVVSQSIEQPLELVRLLPIAGPAAANGQAGAKNTGAAAPSDELLIWIEKP